MLNLPKAEEGRFWARVDVGHPLGCWEWTAGVQGRGYGQFYAGSRSDGTRRPVLAHRWAFEFFHGPLPPYVHGRRVRELDHKCRNLRCVNPDHLELVTHTENIRRGAGNGYVRKTHCKHGHEFTAENTYYYASGLRRCRACARRWGRARRAAVA